MENFGDIIAAARKNLGLSQKELAAKIRKEDGGTISPQYLNDIEHNRRNPTSEAIIAEFALHLKMPKEYLIAAAGMLPSDVRKGMSGAEPEHVTNAFRAFRQALKKK